MYPNTNVEVYVYSFGVVLLVGLGFGYSFANKTHCMPTNPIRYFVKSKGALSPLKVPFHFLGNHKTNRHIDVSKCLRQMFDYSFSIDTCVC